MEKIRSNEQRISHEVMTGCVHFTLGSYSRLITILLGSGTSRRIQNMGFVRDRAAEGLWMTLNGGAMQMTSQQPDGTTDPVFSDTSIKSGGYGIIDVAWKVRTSKRGLGRALTTCPCTSVQFL